MNFACVNPIFTGGLEKEMDKMISTGGTTLLLMGLASSALCSTASADFEGGQMEFQFEYQSFPGYDLPLLANFTVDAFYDVNDGSFEVPSGSGPIDIVVGDYSGSSRHGYKQFFYITKLFEEFEVDFVIEDMPGGFPDMQIELTVGVAYESGAGWSGIFEGTASPYTPFGAGGSPVSGTWSAQIVPAPGGLALLGLGGLARRRRRA